MRKKHLLFKSFYKTFQDFFFKMVGTLKLFKTKNEYLFSRVCAALAEAEKKVERETVLNSSVTHKYFVILYQVYQKI